jgi:putative DNA primase/helicase
LTSLHPGITGRRSGVADHQFEPLAVSPRQACLLLGIGNTRLYQLIGNGELETYRDGRARRITLESIRRRVARLLAAAGATGDIEGPSPRRRGRSRGPKKKRADAWIARARAVPIECELERRGIRLHGKIERTGPCPKCGGDDRFSINSRKGVWNCRGRGVGGGTIKFVEHFDGVDFITACMTLAGKPRETKATRGLLGGRADYLPRVASAPRRNDDASRTARALRIWRDSRNGADTIARRYLASRGVVLDRWPASLRLHPRCPRPKNDGNILPSLPAMVALVEHVERGPVAVQCTYLRPDGGDKADIEKPKAIFGPVAGGAVRFGAPHAGQWLAVAEGIETALSVAAPCSMPAWAAISAGGIKSLVLPAEATHIKICADHDTNGVGERAAHDPAERWHAEGRLVRVAMPPEQGTDFNDVLTDRTAAKLNEVRRVA